MASRKGRSEEVQKALVAARAFVETHNRVPPVLASYALEPDDELFGNPQELAAHLDLCAKHWQKQRLVSRFQEVARRLLDSHEESRTKLLDPSLRESLIDAERQAREQSAKSEREAEEQARVREERAVSGLRALAVDGAVDRLALASAAKKAGVDPDRLAELLKTAGVELREQTAPGDHKYFEDGAGYLRELRGQLRRDASFPGRDELLRDLLGARVNVDQGDLPIEIPEEDPSDSSLYAYLKLEPAATESEIKTKLAEREAVLSRLPQSGPTAEVNTLLSRLDSQVKTYLLDAEKRLAYESAWVGVVAEAVVEALRNMSEIFQLNVIDRDLEDDLVRRACEEHGVDERLGRQAVIQACESLGIATSQVVSRGVLVTCADCDSVRLLAKEDRSTRCECGAELFEECFSCGSVHAASAHRCPGCELDFHARREAEWSTDLAQAYHQRGLIVKALSSVSAALGMDPDFGPARSLRDTLEATDAEARSELTRIRTMLDEREPFGARAVLREFMVRFPSYDGFSSSERDALEARIDEAIARAQSEYRQAIGQNYSEAREIGLIGSLAVARDYADALEELGRIVPAPPPRVKCAIDGASVSVRWDSSPSPGELSYEIRMLQAGRKPVVVAAGADQLEHQQKVTPGDEVRFEVRTERAGAKSDWTASVAIKASYPAQDLVADCGDGQVVLRWSALPGQMLRITREGGRETRAIGTATEPPLVDKNVVNGINYRYSATAVYGAGEVEADQVVTVEATPVPMPVPPPDVAATPEAGQVRVSWSLPPSGTVLVFRSAQPPRFVSGQELAPDELATLGSPLKPGGTGEAVDETPAKPGEVVYYLTVCCAGRYSVCGPCATFVNLLPVKDLMIDERPSDLRVQWGWPEGVSNVRVLVGRGAPSGPRDSAMQALDLSKSEYERRGALILPKKPESGVVAIFPSARIGEDFETGSVAALGEFGSGAERSSEVRFSLERRGRGRKQKARLAIEGEGRLPDVVVIARSRNIPRTRVDDGAVEIAHLSDANREQTVELNGLERPIHVKAFLENDSESANYVIQNGPLSDQVVE